ncbi:hypothetical protein CONPUDRAFT_153884 [Coniophora puteana RWD-64-598 SS2]|uniref:Nicotinamide N-methyltransferase n=1 Tax=Coniophora puteana (strain RWD-64-598) TaxID=741705 RepID=A0A5M3MS04_CONPW|nr:uncharacterized protein CONPUDRAFT_153884 [Coniophora puteana RWD-64-598 SS2]EIW81331.1 hypothetical protein CONPUDRAFT_153884 [Coniophora puteana RWD-64-598 SS2]
MTSPAPPGDIEDILHDALEILGEKPISEGRAVQYGPLTLREGKANTLLADHLFSPALLLAEMIELGEISLHLIELGAGCALPSLLAATLPNPPSLAIVTDYPDETILASLRDNVNTNVSAFSPSCTVKYMGFEWGTDAKDLLALTGSTSAYDVVILSDLLHFDASHDVLIRSLSSLLSHASSARAYIAAGKYTKPEVCHNFVRAAKEAGIICEEHTTDEKSIVWRGKMTVSGLNKDDLGVRKAMCRWWVGRWASSSDS